MLGFFFYLIPHEGERVSTKFQLKLKLKLYLTVYTYIWFYWYIHTVTVPVLVLYYILVSKYIILPFWVFGQNKNRPLLFIGQSALHRPMCLNLAYGFHSLPQREEMDSSNCESKLFHLRLQHTLHKEGRTGPKMDENGVPTSWRRKFSFFFSLFPRVKMH